MKKALIVLCSWVLLVPFFSHSDDNIFTNGTVQTIPAKSETLFECHYRSPLKFFGEYKTESDCSTPIIAEFVTENSHATEIGQVKNVTFKKTINTDLYITFARCAEYDYRPEVNTCTRWTTHDYHAGYFNINNPIVRNTCVSESYPDYTYEIDNNNDAIVDNCANPSQIDLVDSCNTSSGNSVLNVEVTYSEGCFTQSDGSICKYKSVNVGSTNEVYQIDLEASCYSTPSNNLNQNAQLGDLPIDNECTPVGNSTVLACAADPDNSCTQDGSNYGGGSINSCRPGCGYVNDQFLCYDSDTDSDGLPDYNDPDIDGDGIPNGQDLDSDGDGKDDPIDSGHGTGGSTGGGTTNINVDMSGVISAVNKVDSSINDLKDSLITQQEISDGKDITQLINDKKTETETKTDEFLNSTDMAGIESFAQDNSMQDDFFQINSAISGSSCTNPNHSSIGDLDICSKITAARPYLYIAFALMTFIALIYRFAYYIKGQ